jgi:hypothetical protein
MEIPISNKIGDCTMRNVLFIWIILALTTEVSADQNNIDSKIEPVTIFQLKKEYSIWEPVSFIVQNNTEAELMCNISLEWLINGRRTGAEVPDIAMKSESKKSYAWIIKPQSKVEAIWNPKDTPKIYYKGHKGDGRFMIVCRASSEKAKIFKLKSAIFSIK